MLNQAEVYWETGELFGLMSTEDMEDYGELQLRYRQHRDRPTCQHAGAVHRQGRRPAPTVWLAISSWKQGPMRQGGPADTMLRRFVVPEDFDPDGGQPVRLREHGVRDLPDRT